MSRATNDRLLPLVESFFRDHLQRMSGASAHTVRAYRDALRLLFSFLADRGKCSVSDLTLSDLKVEAVKAFLVYLESKRANKAASRNYRLTAIRSFFRHLVRNDLSHAAQYQQVLALPSKKDGNDAGIVSGTGRCPADPQPAGLHNGPGSSRSCFDALFIQHWCARERSTRCSQ
jgi:hypothetical protein